jgi:hypothetical protein
MANYKDWIDAIEIKVDYFSAFVKAWIAFNCWYDSGTIPGNHDQDKIEYIANEDNDFKTYINRLLAEETPEGLAFQENVALLHGALLGSAIRTQSYVGISQTISFSEVAIKNRNNQKTLSYRRHNYKCERSRGMLKTKITHTANNKDVFVFEQEEYNEDVLRQQSAFTALSAEKQRKCLECYAEMRPYIIESVLDASEIAKNIGSYRFVNSVDKISRAIIIILYLLRCALAHGDISPDTQANTVYRYAYEVLVPPLKKLK